MSETFNAKTVEQILKVTQARAEKAEAEVERLKRVLGKIARQTTSDEVDNDDGEFVDYQGGWDTVVTLARSALEAKP